MAKKRTMLHGYGKINQRLDALADTALRAGHREQANNIQQKSASIFYARRAVVGNGR